MRHQLKLIINPRHPTRYSGAAYHYKRWWNKALKTTTTKEAKNLTKCFYKDGDLYSCSITNPEVELTNNLVKYPIHFVILNMPITQGIRFETRYTQSKYTWIVNPACTRRKYSLFQYKKTRPLNGYNLKLNSLRLINLLPSFQASDTWN